MKVFKAFWKTILMITVLYVFVTATVLFFVRQHTLELDTNRVLERANQIHDEMENHENLHFDSSVVIFPAQEQNEATRTIKEGASYSRQIKGKDLRITIPVNDGAKTLYYVSVKDQITPTSYTSFFIIFLALILWLISVFNMIRRQLRESVTRRNTVAKIKNIERSPMTQSYLITDDDDPVTTALNHLGETIQQRIISNTETKESLYEFIEFFEFPIFVYDGKGAIHRSNAAFQNEFSDTKGIDSFSPYTDFLNFLVDKMVKPDIQNKIFFFENMNSYYQVFFNPLDMLENRYMVVMTDVSQYHQMIQSHNDFVENISKAFDEPLRRLEGSMSQFPLNETTQQMRKDLSWLDNLVTDALILSKPMLKTKRSKFNLLELTNEILDSFAETINQKNLQIHLDIALPEGDPREDIQLNSELPKIRIIIERLVENAILDSKVNGQIEILFDQDENKKKVHMTIKDSGPGLTRLERTQVFEAFYRPAHIQKRVSSTGLGLAIVRKNVQELGCHIHVQSKKGQGTSFTLSLK